MAIKSANSNRGVLRNALSMLSTQDRSRLGLLILAMLAGTFLELISLGAIVPLVSILIGSDESINVWLPGGEKNFSRETFVVGASLALVSLFLVRLIALVYIRWRIFSFGFALQVRLQEEMFRRYLSQKYEFFLERNSSLLAFRVNSASIVVSGVIDPIISVLTDGLVSVGLVLILLYLEPTATVFTIFFFGVASFSFHRATTSRIRVWGGQRKQFASQGQIHLYQGLHGIKDVKIFGREGLFADRFSHALKEGVDPMRRFALVQFLPRLGLEFIAVSAFAVVVVSMVLSGSDLSEIAPIVALFSVAAFRIMPAFSRLIHSSQTVDHARELISDLGIDFKLGIAKFESDDRDQRFERIRSIEIDNVSYEYSTSSGPVLHQISFSIDEGESVGIVGSSGGGKSTLVDLVIGLLTPTKGAIRVAGLETQRDLRKWQNSIGYVPQSLYLLDDSIMANVAFGLNPEEIDEARVWAALKDARLDDFVRELEDGLESNVGDRGVRLSGGQRQRIGIARALYSDPPFLLLDEATSSLDVATEQEFMEVVWGLQKVKTVMIIAHRISTVERCDRIIRIESGRIVDIGGFEVLQQMMNDE